MKRFTDSRDGISRVSCGEAACNGRRRERRVGQALLLACLLLATACAVTYCDAVPATVDAPPGPVCPSGTATQRTCF